MIKVILTPKLLREADLVEVKMHWEMQGNSSSSRTLTKKAFKMEMFPDKVNNRAQKLCLRIKS